MLKHTDRSSTILMFVVFFLSFTVLWNITDLISKVENQRKGSITYDNTLTFNIVFTEIEELRGEGRQAEAEEYVMQQLKALFDIIENTDNANLSLSNLFLPVESRQEYVLCEIILKKNTALPYETQENIDESGVLLIGESLKENSVRGNDGLTLNLSDRNYPINAVLKNYGINGQDERIIVLYENLNNAERAFLFKQLGKIYFENFPDGITISIGAKNKSFIIDAYMEFEDYSNELENADINIVPAREQAGELNYWYELYHTVFGGISMIFALLSGIIVSSLWFEYHQREFLIRLTYGYTKRKLYTLIAGRLGAVSGLSLMCSTFFWIVRLIIKERTLLWDRIMLQCIFMLFGTVFLIFITTAYPLKKLMLLDPADGLKKCGR